MLIFRTLRRRRLISSIAAASAGTIIATSFFALGSTNALAAGPCATPGAQGPGGTLTGVVNTYYPGTGSAAAGATSINVGAPSGAAAPIAAGDMLLVMQMQGADFDYTNTDSYGHGPPAATPASGYTALNTTGRYEYVMATSGVTAGSVNVSGLGTGAGLVYSYTTAAATGTAGQRRFQVIRVPQYTTATTSNSLTAAPWNGTVGGVLAVDTTGALTLAGTVSLDGLGFRGAPGIQRAGAGGLANTDRVTSATLAANGNKAEGIAGTPLGTSAGNGYPGGDAARGAPGNAGGGGTDGRPSNNDENSGGGGGGNGGAGGIGGNTWSSNLPRGGYGGVQLPIGSSRIFLGGGGGAGSTNNSNNPSAAGATGGGMALIRAGSVSGAGTISANGADAYNLTENDGAGGGGAGGTIVLTSPSASLAGATLRANGGRGGNAWAAQAGAGSAHGPGGGGGGGAIITSSAPTSTSVTGGPNGITTTGNLAYGAGPGSGGQTSTAAPSAIPGVSGGAECADLSITKSGPATVGAGGAVAYQLVVANNGPSAASTVSVTDTLPAGVTFVSVSASNGGWSCSNAGNASVTCTRATWASGSSTTFTINVTAQNQAGTMTNTASVSSATPDPTPTNNNASANTTVTAVADLAVTKVGPPTVVAGGNVSYTVSASNNGPSNASNVSLVDTLPAGVTFVSVTPSNGGWTCNNAGNVSVTCTRGNWNSGASTTFTIVVTAPAQAGSLSNTASISSTTPDPDTTNNTGTANTSVTGSANLAVTKSGPATVVAGGNVSYTIDASNLGPSNASNVSLVDTLPAGVTFVSMTPSNGGWTCNNAGNVSVTCTRGTWNTGASTSFTLVVTAPNQGGPITNTVAITSTTPDPNTGNNTDTANTTVTASADLAVTKMGPANVTAGGTVTYTVAASNLGPSSAANVSLVDTLPAGVTFVSVTPSNGGWTCNNAGNVSVTCTRGTWNTGASTTFTIVVTAPAQGGSLTNSASIASTTADPNSGNNSASVGTTVDASADLSVTKSGPATVTAGANVTYTLDAANNGPSNAANVSLVDTLPAGVTFVSVTPSNGGWTCNNSGNVSVTCTRGTWNTGASTTFTVVVTAPNQAAALTNTAAISSTTADPNSGNNSDTANTTVNASADLAITKAGPGTVTAAGNVSYTLTASNNGPSDAANVSLTDTLPAGVTFVSITPSNGGWTCNNAGNVSATCTRATWAAGASTVFTLIVTAPPQAGSLTNTVSITSTTADPNTGNNTDSVNTAVTASADLAVTKLGPGSVTAAGNVTYDVTVENLGPSDATGVNVVDTLPAGVTFVSATPSNGGWTCNNSGNVSVTCTRATWNAGASTTFTIVVTAPNDAASLTNTVSIASTTPDSDSTNNTDSVSTTVTASADLRLVKNAPATVAASGNVTYTLDVDQLGPSSASNVSVVDTLPAGVTFVSVNASNGGWTCNNAGNVSVTCTRATWAAGSSTTFTIIVTAPAQAGSLNNSATVSATTPDPTPGNNTDTASTSVTASADLAVTKSGPATVVAGGNISYTVDAENLGPSDAANVSVIDALPAGVTFVSVNASNGGWTCNNAGNVSVTCTRATWAVGSSTAFTIVVTAPAQSASLSNSVSISSTTADPNSGNNTATAPTTVSASADLAVTKTGPATVTAGGSISYTVDAENLGPSDAANVSLVDTLPAGVTFVSVTPSNGGWTCNNAANTSVTCTRTTWTSGSSTTFTIVVTAPAQSASLSNSVSISSTTADPDSGNNSDTANTIVGASADLSVTKSGPATVVAGGNISYTVDAENLGPSSAANVSLVDTLPAGVTFVSVTPSNGGWTCNNAGNVSVTCTRATWASGSSTAFTIMVTAPAQSASLTNSVSITSTTADPDSGNNSDTANTTVNASADLAVTKAGPATVTAGGNISYTVDAENLGPSDAANVSLVDTLPAGVTFVSVTPSNGGWTCNNAGNTSVTCTRATWAAGASTTFIIIVTAPNNPASLTNSVSITSTTPDPDSSNNAASVGTSVGASADLAVTKTGPATVTAGGSVSYTVDADNFGPSDAANVSLVDTLPAGVTFVSVTPSNGGWTCNNAGNASVTCTRGTWAAGASTSFTIVVTAPSQGGSLTNSVAISSTTADPDSGNNSDTANTTVNASADLSVTKSGPATVTASGSITYTLDAANLGPSSAANVSLIDTLPAGVTFVSVNASTGGWTCNNAGNVSVTCTRGNWNAGASTTFTVVVTAPAQGGSITNAVAITSTTADPDSGNNSDTANTAVTASADLSVTKGGPANVTAGDNLSYTVDADNFGPSDAANVSLVDTLPAGVTFVSVTPSNGGWTCNNAGNVSVTCTRGNWNAGASTTFTVVVTAPAQGGSITNAVAITSTTADPDSGNNGDTANTTVNASANLSVTKSGPATVVAGSDITYTLDAENFGPSDAASVSLVDTLPAGVTFVSVTPSNGGWTCNNAANTSVTCTRATWNAGASTTFTIVVTAPAQAGALTNTSSITSTTPDPTPGNNTDTANTTVTASADLSVTKSGPANVTAGGNITYTLDADNNGPSNAANVSVVDTLPAGVTFVSVNASTGGWTCNNAANTSVTCTRANWNAGASTTFTIVITAPAQGGPITNEVAIASTTPDPDSGNNSDTANTTVNASADLAVTKSGPATVTAGGNITYTLDADNNGPSSAANVSVVDTLPAGVTFVSVSASNGGWTCNNAANTSVTCTRANWNAGASTTFTIVITAPNNSAALTNTAVVASTTSDPTPGNNSDTANTTVNASADLAITKSGPANVTASGAVTYTLDAENLGPSSAANVSVVDTLPAGVTFVSVSASNGGWTCNNAANTSVTCTRANWNAGASTTFTIVVTAPAQGGSLTNSVAISSTTADPDSGNNSDTANTTVNASADLAVTKAGPANVTAGGAISYDVDVENLGPSSAANVSVVDTLPAGVTFVSVNASNGGWTCNNAANTSVTCTRATWNAGASTTFTIVVTAPAQGGSLTNSVAISSTTADPDPGNNSASAGTTVDPSADLSVTKSGPATVTAGGSVTYTVDAENLGPSDAANVSVVDTLPAGVTFVSVTPSNGGWTCNNAANTSVTCTRATWAVGSSTTFTIVVTAPAQSASLTNSVSIASTTADPDTGNNSDTANTSVGASADLSVTKSGPATVTAGANLSYTVDTENLGPDDAANVSLTDTLPAGATFVSVNASTGGWTCTNAGNTSVTCTRANWNAGASTTFTIVVTAPAQGGSLTNAVAIASTTSDPDSRNNSDTANTTVEASADLQLTKDGPAEVTPGATVRYQLSVYNDGPSDAASVTVTDDLPGGVTFVSAGGRGWTCTNAGDISVTCSRGALAAGDTAPVLSVRVTAPDRGAQLTNIATVSSPTPDPDPRNSSDAATTRVGRSADLSIVKLGPETAAPGSQISYTLRVSNAGPDAAFDVRVKDTLPSDVTFVSADGQGWSCTNRGSRVVTCDRNRLASNTTAPDITIVVDTAPSVGDVTNTAAVSAGTFDPTSDNNSGTAATTIERVGAPNGGTMPDTGARGVQALIAIAVALLTMGAVFFGFGYQRREQSR